MRTIQHLPRAPAAAAGDGPFRRLTQALLLLLVFSVPWATTVSLLGSASASRFLGYACAGPAVVAMLVEGRRHRWLDAHLLLAAWTAWVLLSLVWTIDTGLTLDRAGTAVSITALVLFSWEFLPGKEGALRLARAYAWGCWIPIVQLLWLQLVVHAKAIDNRLDIPGAQPNDVAYMLCLALPLVWYLSLRAERFRWLYWLQIPLALYAILLTGSRAGLVVGALACVLVPWTIIAGRPARAAGFLLALAVLLPVGIRLIPERQASRLSTTGTELSSGTLNNRTVLWAAAYDIWAGDVINGVGAGASRVEIQKRTGFLLGAHNTPLSVAAELGVVGLSLFCLTFLAVFRRGLMTRGDDRRLVIVLAAVLIVGLQVRHWEYEKPLWVVVAVLLGLSASAEYDRGVAASPRAAVDQHDGER
jgi:O-antigen ligase